MSFKALLCFGAMALTMTSAVAAANDAATAQVAGDLMMTATETASDDLTAAEPSLYSAAYLPPKPVAVGPPSYNPYEGAVASTSTNVVRSPGNFGQVTAFHKTVETPFSSAHKSDVRYTNDAQQPYHPAGPYAALAPYPAPVQYATPVQYPVAGQYPFAYPAVGQYPYAYPTAGQYPYAPTGQYPYASAGQYSYAPAAVGSYPYATAPVGPIKPYGYGPVVTPAAPHAYAAPVVTPQSFSHASFSGPYGAHYSYKR